MRARGFLLGATSGRTTLAGEGLQHQDGHSHHLAYPYPNLMTYDPAFAYELAVIIRDGIRRMYENQEDIFYYITVMNESYVQPAMPKGVKEGILKGIYKLKTSKLKNAKLHAQLLGSGTILNKVMDAQKILEEKYQVASDVWSVTSYKELYREALQAERWNMFHPQEQKKIPYVSEALKGSKGVFVAASDYVKTLSESISKWIPGPLISLGTDGFGRSDGRRHLRDFFEIDERYITLATLYNLHLQGKIEAKVINKAIKDLDIDPEKLNPMIS
jgi:pyruvate dehydrogenase E1 component